MTFTKILCPTDFSACSERALRTAVRLANERGAELVLAHAWDVPPSLYAGGTGIPPGLFQRLADDAQRGIDDAVREAARLGAKRVSGQVATGSPWLAIVELLEQRGFDLCVLGTHGRTGLTRILLGSIAEQVIRHAPCSVLAVRGDGEPRPFSHVLCPTDFSTSADQAIARAAELVAPGGAITLLHVMEPPINYSGAVSIADFARDLDMQAATALDARAARLRRDTAVPVTVRSRIGYPGAQILSAIDADPTIDLVVMGSHGRTGIKRALLGSVAEKVVRHARCPVLVARARE